MNLSLSQPSILLKNFLLSSAEGAKGKMLSFTHQNVTGLSYSIWPEEPPRDSLHDLPGIHDIKQFEGQQSAECHPAEPQATGMQIIPNAKSGASRWPLIHRMSTYSSEQGPLDFVWATVAFN